MKLYRAELYAINHSIPYTDKNKWVVEEISRSVEYYDRKYTDGQFEKVFIHKGTLVVRKKFFRMLEDIATGEKFSQLTVSTAENHDKIYQFTKVNQRLYAMLGQQMSNHDIREYYESLIRCGIQLRKEELLKIIEEEHAHWNPIPKKVSTKQYVKMIEQMRKDI